ncbi:MAG: dimethylsulfoniopropionate demethylase [Pseudomonadota bacterium]
MSQARLQVSRRQRATPYTKQVEALGVTGFSIVNHTILPKRFQRSVDEDYWHLKQHVQIWDVGCQRQVELKGPDAAKLAQLLTARDLRGAVAGQCLYAPLVDQQGGMLNDPIILKLGEDHFWFSIADADMLYWAQGIAYGMGLDLSIDEPDVWPLALQGPKSDDVLSRVFGDQVRDIPFFGFIHADFHGHDVVIARSGYSLQGGFELYVDGFELGPRVWEAVWEAGLEFDIAPGSPNLIERIEGGLMSLGNEMTRRDNPLECGLEKYCELSGEIEFIGLAALQKVARAGVTRQIRGIRFDGDACPPCQYPWDLKRGAQTVGYVTSAIWSPRFEQNVALAMVHRECWNPGDKVTVCCEDGSQRNGEVTCLPMED